MVCTDELPGSSTRALHIKTESVILLVVLYGCETWSHILWAEHGLRVLKNRIPRKVFQSKREEIIGDWRKPQNEELHNLYCSSDIVRMVMSRKIRLVGRAVRTEEKRNTYSVLVRTAEDGDVEGI
jgi:hypothetical protein